MSQNATSAAPFQREDRYIVIKRSDLEKVPVGYWSSLIEPIGALQAHLPHRECLVIESDWPEFEPAWASIEARVTGKPAEHHQGDPVALPARKPWNGLLPTADNLKGEGYNACLDELAKLGPLYSRPAQGEAINLAAVATLVDDGDGGLKASWLLEGGSAELFAGMTLLVADNAPDLCAEDGSAQVYTHADPAEVERLRSVIEQQKNLIESLRAELIESHSIDASAERCAPELTDDLREILGRPNFTCHFIAKALRVMGHSIAHKSEDEQAVVIHWLLGIYLKHGSDWRQRASAELEEASKALKS